MAEDADDADAMMKRFGHALSRVSTASRIGPKVEPQPTIKVSPSELPVDFGERNFLGQLLEFTPALGSHRHMEGRTAGGMSHFVMLETGDHRVFSADHPSARRCMPGDCLDGIRLVILRART